MPSRRERAIERFCRERGVPRFIPTPTELALLEALEAELAADLESEETVDRVARAIFASDQERRVEDAKFSWAEAAETTREFYLDDARAALEAALELDGG